MVPGNAPLDHGPHVSPSVPSPAPSVHVPLAPASCVLSGKNSGRKGARWRARTRRGKLSRRPVVARLTDPVLVAGGGWRTEGDGMLRGTSVGEREPRSGKTVDVAKATVPCVAARVTHGRADLESVWLEWRVSGCCRAQDKKRRMD